MSMKIIFSNGVTVDFPHDVTYTVQQTTGDSPVSIPGLPIGTMPQNFSLEDILKLQDTLKNGQVDESSITNLLPIAQKLVLLPPQQILGLVSTFKGLFGRKKDPEPAVIPKAELVTPQAPADVLALESLNFSANDRNARYLKEIGGLGTLQKAPATISGVNKGGDGAFNWEDAKVEGDCCYIHIFDNQGRGIGVHPASGGRNTDLREFAGNAKFALVYRLKKENGGAGDMIERSLVTAV